MEILSRTVLLKSELLSSFNWRDVILCRPFCIKIFSLKKQNLLFCLTNPSAFKEADVITFNEVDRSWRLLYILYYKLMQNPLLLGLHKKVHCKNGVKIV